MNNFGTNLRNLRKSQKLTLEGLGKALNMSKSTLSDYERGKTSPSLDVCEQIANFFGTKIDNIKNSESSEKIQNTNWGALDFSTERDQLKLHNKLLSQQVEGLNIQLQLVKQLLTSREAEIRSILTQVRLLEEKIK
jgi:transcriptional regulator with XRE-family HTH domain